ncbi:DNA topoisomerase 1 [Acaryochloris thomasi RCC1774]|uniref:DNA topoisomerase 1 n=1 Tax=Acaryochloris thomasi RCC1774 TaxID=1764569 RepID=A0A2W1JGJ5_9CYAN|nr:type I DNA topoisomerase [Acaryochloris thomasi]PZD70755.1 DNA topoisomerase 1 [Acaryochloris thomasi RCC1774]
MVMKLLIVESPGKIKKLKGILGSDWIVKASVGHIRELANDGKDSLGFDLGLHQIDCRYIPRSPQAKQTISDLRAATKKAKQVFLATDPDREGETIAWHLQDALHLKKAQRVVYTEITDRAVKAAVSNPRPLNQALVDAGRCRDCLDKLVGYRGSPLVWSLNNGAKSVGRVQSATLHLICQREREIQAFTSQDYWSVFVDYQEGFRAFYHGSSSPSHPEQSSIDDAGASVASPESTRVLSEAEAERLVGIAQAESHTIERIEGKLSPKQPPAPFITSSLQQAAGSRQKFSPERTMEVAQKLYEKGLITYMRTDSVQLSPDFCQAARSWLQANDSKNVPQKVAKQRSKKGAQEAHEAIRPTELTKSSEGLKQELPEDEFKLYVLIWMRAISSQCKPAQIRKTKVLIRSGPIQWQAKGQVVEFKGYSKYWQDISADKQLPVLQDGQQLRVQQVGHEQKQTQPPSRFTEPKLVQIMEKKGIGRPSTYATTIKTLKLRQYVEVLKKQLQPTMMGLEVDEFMGKALPELLEAKFTAQMEGQLDLISEGKQDWQQYLISWNQSYFEPALGKAVSTLPAPKPGQYPERKLQKSRTKCPLCNQALSKVPTKSKKVKKGFFLKCQQGCETEPGKELVMFWSSRNKAWQQPGGSGTGEGLKAPKLTEYVCPACDLKLEEYFYTKDGQQKSLLRCSSAATREDRKHKDVVYFQSKGAWWSPKFGVLGEEAER